MNVFGDLSAEGRVGCLPICICGDPGCDETCEIVGSICQPHNRALAMQAEEDTVPSRRALHLLGWDRQ